MRKKLNIGVIFGGRSGEHEVSLVSAAAIIKGLDRNKYSVTPIGITRAGRWVTGTDSLKALRQKSGWQKLKDTALTPDPTKKSLIPTDVGARRAVASPLPKKLDVVFPVLHGTYGEDGTVQGLLELANVPYVGAGVLASSVGMDKIAQKFIFKQTGLPVVPFCYFTADEYRRSPKVFIAQIEKLRYPVFVKPANLGSSVGISKAGSRTELVAAIKYAMRYDRRILVEKAIIRPKEIEVAVLGNENPRASVPGQIVSSNEFYDYDAKYIDGKSRPIIPAPLPRPVSRTVRAMAVRAFRSIDGAGMARVDFLLTQKNSIYISEVNTIPGFTPISMYPKLWEKTGLPYSRLLDRLISLAQERHAQKQRLTTSYQPKSSWYR